MKPHRGAVVLVLGILSLVMSCVVLGIIAWVLGRSDLRDMDMGRMDPSGRGLTQAGKICGMINVILSIVGLVLMAFWIIFVVVLGVGAAAAGAAGAGGP